MFSLKAASASIDQTAKVLKKRLKDREAAQKKQERSKAKGGTHQSAHLLGVTPKRKKIRRQKYYNYYEINCHGWPHIYNMITYISNVSHDIHINIIHTYTMYCYVITPYTV